VTDVATPNDTTLTGLLTIDAPRTPSAEARLLIVTTESGQSTIEFFVVAPGTPTVTAVLPRAGEPGQTVAVTLKGLNLTGATVNEASADIALQNQVVADDETLTLEVVIDPMAATAVDHTLTLSRAAARRSSASSPGAAVLQRRPPALRQSRRAVTVRFDGVNLSTIVTGTGVNLTDRRSPSRTPWRSTTSGAGDAGHRSRRRRSATAT
jgi:hypothetical protein